MNPYIQFVKENYKKVKEKNPSFKSTQVMKKVAEMYRASKKQNLVPRKKGGFKTAQYIEPFVPM